MVSLQYLPKYLLVLLLGVVLLWSPFPVDEAMLYPTQFGQLFFLYRLAVIIAACLVLLPGSIRHVRVPDIILLVAVIYATIAASIIYKGALPYNYFIIPALLVLYAGFRYVNENVIPYLFVIILISGTIEAIYGNLQLYGVLSSYSSIYRLTGTFFNPAPFAGYLVMSFPVAIGCWMYQHQLPKLSKVLSVLSMANILVIFVILPATASRAAWFAALVSGASLLLSHPWVQQRVKGIVRYGGWVLLGVCMTGIFIFTYNLKKDSANGRLLIWKVAFYMMKDKPLMGFGFEKFKAAYMDYQASYLSSDQATVHEKQLADNIQYAYNELIHVGVEFGIAGLVLLAILLLVVVRAKANNEPSSIYLRLARSGLLSLAVFSMFSYPTEIVPVLIIAVCYMAIVACYTKSVFTIRISRLQLLLLPVAGYSYLLIGKQERAFHLWNRASQYYAAGNYKESLVSYQQASIFLQHNGLFLSHYGKALSMDGRNKESQLVLQQSREYQEDAFTCLAIGDDYKALGLYDQAVESYQLAAAMVPVQLYPRYCLARLYVEKGDTVKAIPVAKEIIDMQEKVGSTAVQQIKQEMKDLLEALNKK